MRSLAAMGRVCAAVILLGGALLTTQLSVPGAAVACTCKRPDGVAKVAGNPEIVVVAGTIAAIELANGPFGPQTAAQLTVLRVFQGQLLPGPMQIRSGNGADCIPTFETGWNVVLTATLVEGRLEPVPCGHFGLLTTPEGQALLQQFEAAFGQGAGPPPASRESTVDLATIAIVAVVGVVVLVMIGALIAALGRRDRATGP